MKLVYVDNHYISYLQQLDHRVLQNKSHRPYIGPVLTVNNHSYFAPFETAKPGKRVNNRLTFTIRKSPSSNSPILSFLLINDMIPVSTRNYIPIDMDYLKSLSPKKFDLLIKEQNFARSNQQRILKKALSVYHKRLSSKVPFFNQMCLDFRLLEHKYLDF